MVKCKVNRGFVYVTNYSYKFRELIQCIAEKAEQAIPCKKLNGIAIFLFGSPSRQEMVDKSDADIMIIRESDNDDYLIFRNKFIKLLEKENFEKIDVPDWGNYEDCEAYIKDSITEGNQVVESKFIYGDYEVNNRIEALKIRYCTKERFERVFCFQKLYFDQYYTQRTKPGIKNVKYGHGGTRDFMFLTWFINIIDTSEGRKINTEDNFPLAYKSLSSLYERELINLDDYRKYSESVNIVLILRNEILIQNELTPEAGLTYLDERTLNLLFKRRVFKEDSLNNEDSLRNYLEIHIQNIAELKNRIWDLFISYIYSSRGSDWTNKFKKFLDGNIKRTDIELIEESDDLLQMAVIWNISKKENLDLFEHIFDIYSNSNKWTVLASLCCHKECSDKILNKVLEKGFRKGYEYLLKIISRNKNVSKETLKKIIENPSLEYRYKIVAKTAYDKGVEKANDLR
ncbi:MAG: nucleotidyltransferase domain-containing protein [Nanoarchaeota archaeon]